MIIQPFTEGNFFHIHNYAVGNQQLFTSKAEVNFFLNLYLHVGAPVFDTYAYAILPDQFHFLLYVKENVWMPDAQGVPRLLNPTRTLLDIMSMYTQGVQQRTGQAGMLFERPFRRRVLETEQQLKDRVLLLHQKALPIAWGESGRNESTVVNSYAAIVRGDNTLIKTDTVLSWFESIPDFVAAHHTPVNESALELTWAVAEPIAPLYNMGTALKKAV